METIHIIYQSTNLKIDSRLSTLQTQLLVRDRVIRNSSSITLKTLKLSTLQTQLLV